MSSTLTKAYDTLHSRDLLREEREFPRVAQYGALPARVAAKAITAYHREQNRRQNFIRWSTQRTNITSTWARNTWHQFIFDTPHFASEEYKGRKVHWLPLQSWVWQCGEPGIYNFKGNVTIVISVPAVPATMITRATVRLKHVPFDGTGGGLGTGYIQDEDFGQVRVIPNVPPTTELIYLRAFSLNIKDKLALNAGDRVSVEWSFQSTGDIGFIEEYNGYISIQKTGVRYIDGRCCHE